eukprot:2973386-Prymnesium_polylepis.1
MAYDVPCGGIGRYAPCGAGLLCPRIQFCPRRHVVRHTPLYLSNNYRSAAAAGRSMTRESTLVPGLNLKAPQAFCVLT